MNWENNWRMWWFKKRRFLEISHSLYLFLLHPPRSTYTRCLSDFATFSPNRNRPIPVKHSVISLAKDSDALARPASSLIRKSRRRPIMGHASDFGTWSVLPCHITKKLIHSDPQIHFPAKLQQNFFVLLVDYACKSFPFDVESEEKRNWKNVDHSSRDCLS